MTYTTKQGDTFDLIALSVYGRESIVAPLLEANPGYAETLVFQAGVSLMVPVLNPVPVSLNDLPPWRR